MDERGWGGAADTIGRGGSWLPGFEGEPKDRPCPDIADADDVGSADTLVGVAMADDAFGGDTCRVDGGVVNVVDREWGEARPDDADSTSIEGDDDKIFVGDGGPVDVLGGIAEVDKAVCVDAYDSDSDGIGGRDNRGVADAGTEGAIGSSVDVDTEGGANIDFEHVVAATRAFSINSCCISSSLRAFIGSLSLEFLVGSFASCLFVELVLVDAISALIVNEDPFWFSAFANCFA